MVSFNYYSVDYFYMTHNATNISNRLVDTIDLISVF